MALRPDVHKSGQWWFDSIALVKPRSIRGCRYFNPLWDRLMVGQPPLKRLIQVRTLSPEPTQEIHGSKTNQQGKKKGRSNCYRKHDLRQGIQDHTLTLERERGMERQEREHLQHLIGEKENEELKR